MALRFVMGLISSEKIMFNLEECINSLPPISRELFAEQDEEFTQLDEKIKQQDQHTSCTNNETAKRFLDVPQREAESQTASLSGRI